MRFRVTVLAAIVSLMAIAAGSVAAVALSDNPDVTVTLVTGLFGMIALIIPALLGLLKAEDTNNKVTNGYMDNKIKSNVKVAMAERAEEFSLGIIDDERKEDEK